MANIAARPLSLRKRLTQHVGEDQREKIALFISNPLSLVGIALVLGWVLVALLAVVIATHPQDALQPRTNPLARLQGPSSEHWFGTDHLGRDIFSRVVIGARTSMTAGLIPVVFAMIIGVPLGAVAGYFRGFAETVILRVADTLFAVPRLLLAIAVAAALGPSLLNAMIAIIVVWWPYYARLVYGQTLSLKERGFVEAARGLGVAEFGIIRTHIVPNTIPSIIIMFTTDLGFSILTMASLSFIGMGAQEPSPEWGLAVSNGRAFLPDYWWVSLFPGLAIFTLVLGFNLMGDGLRDALDPRRRR